MSDFIIVSDPNNWQEQLATALLRECNQRRNPNTTVELISPIAFDTLPTLDANDRRSTCWVMSYVRNNQDVERYTRKFFNVILFTPSSELRNIDHVFFLCGDRMDSIHNGLVPELPRPEYLNLAQRAEAFAAGQLSGVNARNYLRTFLIKPVLLELIEEDIPIYSEDWAAHFHDRLNRLIAQYTGFFALYKDTGVKETIEGVRIQTFSFDRREFDLPYDAKVIEYLLLAPAVAYVDKAIFMDVEKDNYYTLTKAGDFFEDRLSNR